MDNTEILEMIRATFGKHSIMDGPIEEDLWDDDWSKNYDDGDDDWSKIYDED